MSHNESDFDLNEIYHILRRWAKNTNHEIGTYSQLAQEYLDIRSEHIDPHTELNKVLGIINRSLAIIGAPPISALVVNNKSGVPGNGFWGCSTNVPAKPPTKNKQFEIWTLLVQEVIAYSWPKDLP